MWHIWIDRGGTFTDVVARASDGSLVTTKVLSQSSMDGRDAGVLGIRAVLGLEDDEPIPLDQIAEIRMGTTVATNALLERTGERTVLVITRGFADLLRIGDQQRPRLFDLDIRLPQLLHERVVEAPERLAADGRVLVPLDDVAVRMGLQSAWDDGIRAVAVALLHGWRQPDHEQQIGRLAREIGFRQVSLSHETSPLSKLVARADTTVVDAYLSPVLRRHIDAFRRQVGTAEAGTRLQFMQSNGGLTDADLFGGKDAILSGPAGGVVGMAECGRRAGFRRLIGFDMGGTSTDVTHYDGHLERSLETEVAGVRVRAPMLDIHTVAAGGGSVLSFDGSRFRVGPASAGADPGPACYRRGGPLTITDANVLLGRVRPEHFPSLFGTNGDESIDVELVRQQFDELAREVAKQTGDPRFDAETVAEGFVRVAVQNMASAIKKITIERGHDVTDYALNCFGGAGGQHACLVADELGVSTVLVHPLAGVLSAYGMGLADVRALRERQANLPLDHDGVDAALAVADVLRGETVAELRAQGFADGAIESIDVALLRVEGTEQSLRVDFGPVEGMRDAFESAHRAQFGFVASAASLQIEVVAVEAVGRSPVLVDPAPSPVAVDVPAPGHVSMRSAGATRHVPLHRREDLRAGEEVEGPAIVAEATSTTIIDAGWSGVVDTAGVLRLRRREPRAPRHAVGTDADPIMLEVFNNLFMSIAERMGLTLARTARSVNIKERLDFSCALFDADGNLVANAPHVPVHLGSMGASVRTVARRNAGVIRPGDGWLLNNPFDGGTHLPDVTVISPVFDDRGERIRFWVGSRGHHADIGGKTPGSNPPDSRSIEEEGVVIDNFLAVRDGRLRDEAIRTMLGSGPWPCRNIDQNLADLRAQLAANETGAVGIGEMVDTYGWATVNAYMRHVQANAEESVRRVLDVLDDGHFRYPLDNGLQVEVDVRVDRAARTATIDFSGTSPQDDGNHNAPVTVCRAAVLYVFRTLVADDIPLNEGCLRAIDIVAPNGTIINPDPPAAVVAGNTEVSQAITDALFGALGVVAGSQGTMNNLIYGNQRHQNYETFCGGTGAGPDFDGASAVHSHMTNTRMTDPEVLEQRLPVRVDELSIRRGSGGSGRHRGGDGAVRRLRFLEPMTVTIVSSNRVSRPFGVDGGQPGDRGRNAVERADGCVEELAGDCEIQVGTDDVVVMETPGGGGFGSPDGTWRRPRGPTVSQ